MFSVLILPTRSSLKGNIWGLAYRFIKNVFWLCVSLYESLMGGMGGSENESLCECFMFYVIVIVLCLCIWTPLKTPNKHYKVQAFKFTIWWLSNQ